MAARGTTPDEATVGSAQGTAFAALGPIGGAAGPNPPGAPPPPAPFPGAWAPPVRPVFRAATGSARPGLSLTRWSARDGASPDQQGPRSASPVLAPMPSAAGPGSAAPAARIGADTPRGLVMISDHDLLDGVLRLAAAAGCEVTRVIDPPQARPLWAGAPVVLLDADAARRCAATGLPRRDGVLVLVPGEPPPSVWQHAVGVGAAHVVSLPDAEAWLVRTLAEAAEMSAASGGGRRAGMAVAVVGGCGGAGASIFATALAVAAVRAGARTLLVDCDPLGGGLDLALGAENVAGLRWPEIDVGSGHVSAAAWHAALPAPAVPGRAQGELALLSCDRSPGGPTAAAVAAVLDAGRRAGETVVCDLPRHLTDAAVTALGAVDLTLLVVPAELRASAAAARVAALVGEHGAVHLVVRGPAPGGIEAVDVARALDLPLLAAMRPEPGLARAIEAGHVSGRPRGPLAGAARTVLAELARRTGSAYGRAS